MTVFLYAGQGSQFAGMGHDLYNDYPEFKNIYDSAEISEEQKKLMFDGPDELLAKTENTQPCMALFAAGVTEILKNKGIMPDAACGLSLGEYGALYSAGVWNTKEYLEIVGFRGRVMSEAVKDMTYIMSAVLGTDSKAVEEACCRFKNKGFVTVANYNCPGQYVICGEEKAVSAVEDYMKQEYQARCARLNTTSPFHTYLLKSAGDKLKSKFDAMDFKQPKIPVYMNVTGKKLSEKDDIKMLLEQQVQKSVRFEDVLRNLINDGADNFIEIGPGNVLGGLCRKTARALKAKVNIATIQRSEDIEKLG